MPTTSELIFELSGEHSELPKAELLSVLNSELSGRYKYSQIGQSRLFEIKPMKKDYLKMSELANRLAMCRSFNQLILKAPIEQFSEKLQKLDLINELSVQTNETFKLLSEKLPFFSKLEKSKERIFEKRDIDAIKRIIIEKISSTLNVNVRNPDVLFILYWDFDYELVLVRKLYDLDKSGFESRKPQFRPYFAPISLHPRLARCIVNLAEVPTGGLILDPFCGTGGLLIEAGLIGLRVIGTDVDSNMVKGTINNLKYYNIDNFSVFQVEIAKLQDLLINNENQIKNVNNVNEANIRKSNDNKINASGSRKLPLNNWLDAIITEPPYGRAASTLGEGIEELMKKTFKVCYEILAPKKRLIISLPDKSLGILVNNWFDIEQVFEYRVHRSLTKFIYKLNRKQ